MTYEEAKYWFNHNGASIFQEVEMHQLINEALEKQIPKKLVSTDWYQVRDGVEWKDWKCPTCGRVLWRKELTDEYCKPLTYSIQHHCICGQNIDNN